MKECFLSSLMVVALFFFAAGCSQEIPPDAKQAFSRAPDLPAEGKGFVHVDNYGPEKIEVRVDGRPWMTMEPYTVAAFQLSGGTRKLGFCTKTSGPAGCGNVKVKVTPGRSVVVNPFGNGAYQIETANYTMFNIERFGGSGSKLENAPAQAVHEVDFGLLQELPSSVNEKGKVQSATRSKLWKKLVEPCSKAEAAAYLRGLRTVYLYPNKDMLRAVQQLASAPVAAADVAALCDFIQSPPSLGPAGESDGILATATTGLTANASLTDAARMRTWLGMQGPTAAVAVRTAIRVLTQRLPADDMLKLYRDTPADRRTLWLSTLADLPPQLQESIVLETLKSYTSFPDQEAADRTLTGQMEKEGFALTPQIAVPIMDFIEARTERQYLWWDMWGPKVCKQAHLLEDKFVQRVFEKLLVSNRGANILGGVVPLVENSRTAALVAVYPKFDNVLRSGVTDALRKVVEKERKVKDGQLALALALVRDPDWQVQNTALRILKPVARESNVRAALQKELQNVKEPNLAGSIQRVLKGEDP